jgi:hypothetical protein
LPTKTKAYYRGQGNGCQEEYVRFG